MERPSTSPATSLTPSASAGAGTGIVTQNGGLFNYNPSNVGSFYVGVVAGGTGIYNLNAGTLNLNQKNLGMSCFSATAGTFNLAGGELQTNQIFTNGTGGVFNFSGGTLQATANGGAYSPGTFFTGLTAANVNAGGAFIDSNSYNITVGQSLAGVGGLTKLGAGNLTLSGVNTYAGGTTVANGTLTISAGNNTTSYAGGIMVNSGEPWSPQPATRSPMPPR